MKCFIKAYKFVWIYFSMSQFLGIKFRKLQRLSVGLCMMAIVWQQIFIRFIFFLNDMVKNYDLKSFRNRFSWNLNEKFKLISYLYNNANCYNHSITVNLSYNSFKRKIFKAIYVRISCYINIKNQFTEIVSFEHLFD